MTAYKVIVAERSDLLIVTVICRKCSTTASLDVAAREGSLRMACPSCEDPFGDNVNDALASLAAFHRHARLAERPKEEGGTPKQIFLFEIRQPET